jgi:hypothetical protein
MWTLVAMRTTRSDALAEYERLKESYRHGEIRLATPDGLILRRESCKRVAVPA